MGLRLRKIMKIAPGLKLNFSKTGASLSIGKKGATINVGKDGIRSTVGAPGTGASYSEYNKYSEGDKKLGETAKSSAKGHLVWVVIAIIVVLMLLGQFG